MPSIQCCTLCTAGMSSTSGKSHFSLYFQMPPQCIPRYILTARASLSWGAALLAPGFNTNSLGPPHLHSHLSVGWLGSLSITQAPVSGFVSKVDVQPLLKETPSTIYTHTHTCIHICIYTYIHTRAAVNRYLFSSP